MRISKEKYNNADKYLLDNLNKLCVNPFLDPKFYQSVLVEAGYYFEGGARKFADFSKKLIDEYGDQIKPYLLKLWADVKKQELKMLDDLKVDKVQATTNQLSNKAKKENTKPIDDLENFREELKIIFWLKLIGIALLIISFSKLPYGYYTFLRIFITGTASYSAYIYYSAQKKFWIWVLGFIAILFNPIIPIYLGKESWAIIDICTALIFLISIFFLKEFRSLK